MIDREEAVRAYVRYEILAYIAGRPGACETLRGITSWWLYRQRLSDGPRMVRDAVRLLVGEGHLLARDLPGRETLYAVSKDAFPPEYRNSADEE